MKSDSCSQLFNHLNTVVITKFVILEIYVIHCFSNLLEA